jgi:hypothetical protein
VWEHAGKRRRRLYRREADLADVIALSEAKDAPDLVHADTALDVDDGAVEWAPYVLKVTEDEGLVDVKTTGNDVLAVLQQRSAAAVQGKNRH